MAFGDITVEERVAFGKRKLQKVKSDPDGPIKDWRKPNKANTLVRAYLNSVWPLDDVIPFPDGEYRLERPWDDNGGSGYFYHWHPY